MKALFTSITSTLRFVILIAGIASLTGCVTQPIKADQSALLAAAPRSILVVLKWTPKSGQT